MEEDAPISTTAAASSSMSAQHVHEDTPVSPSVLYSSTHSTSQSLFSASDFADVKLLPKQYSKCDFSDLVELIGMVMHCTVPFLTLANQIDLGRMLGQVIEINVSLTFLSSAD
jgi:hypothetical protein